MTAERTLVLDSEASSRETVVSALRARGHEVVAAPIDGSTFDVLRSSNFEILVINSQRVPNLTSRMLQPLRRACPNADILVLCDDQEIAETVCAIGGVAVSTVKLSYLATAIENVKKRRRSSLEFGLATALTTPLETIRRLIAGEPVDAIVRSVLPVLATDIGADYISLRLLDKEQDEPPNREIFAVGAMATDYPDIASSIESRVIATEKPIFFLDGTTRDVTLDRELVRNGVSAAFGLPLIGKGKLVGALIASAFAPREPFSQSAVDIASLVAGSIALAASQSNAAGSDLQNLLNEAELRASEGEKEIARLGEVVEDLTSARREAQQQSLHALRALTGTIDAREPTRRAHSHAVEQLAVSLAQKLKQSEASVAPAALLHDVGMLAVPDPILSAKRSLSKKEWLQIGKHPITGEELARSFGLSEEIALAIRHHHENWDGTGYPDGLSGEKIPQLARLLRVVDAYVSIRSPRPWRKAFEPKEALSELQQGAGKLFDPIIAAALIELVGTKPNHLAELREGTEMISTLSHEIRSPLTSLIGYSEVLALQPDLSSIAREAASEIKEEALYLSRLVDTLLNLGPGERAIRLNRQTVDLGGLISSRLQRYAATPGRHEFIAAIPDDLPGLLADPDRITQVITNLVDNAVKYSPEGGRVKVSANHDGMEIQVSVEDEGIGIPEADKDRIFEIFYRVDNDAVKSIRGSGLGLAICKKIIEAHGGHIWAGDRDGQGSMFKFTLPIQPEP